MSSVQPILLSFSPGGHTKTALRALAKAWGTSPRLLDLCDPAKVAGAPSFTRDDLCLLGVPSYGGRVPSVAVQRLKLLHGSQTPVVLLVSYGNRHFDDTLIELEDLMTQQGFVPVAGIAAIAEHTICPQYATGRPNAQDCQELVGFGDRIRLQLEAVGARPASMPGNRPYRSFGGIPCQPRPNEACIRCGACVVYCPVHAIDSETLLADPQLCFTCMRCVYLCPTSARSLPQSFVSAIAQKLAPACTQVHSNELFL